MNTRVLFSLFIFAFLLSQIQTKNVRTLDELIIDTEKATVRLHDDILQKYKIQCDLDCTKDCNWHSCSNLSKKLSCDEKYPNSACNSNCRGSKIDKNQSGILLANKYNTISPNDEDVKRTICYSQSMTEVAKDNHDDNDSLLWQYYGSSEGVFRNWPLNGQCGPYDPRVRPWYSLATSDAKNVFILYENSSYMTTSNRSTLAIEVVSRILDTINNVDIVGFMNYNERTLPLYTYTTTGSSTSKTKIINHIEGLVGYDGTNLEGAINDLYDYIRKSENNGNLLKSDTVIFIVSSGIVSNGENRKNNLLSLISTLNNQTIDGFTVGAAIYPILIGTNETSITFFRELACQENGIYSNITSSSQINDVIQNGYSRAMELNKTNNYVTWTEPYEDSSGAGTVVSCAKAVFDDSVTPKRLLGVVAIDIKLNQVLALTDLSSLTSTLTNRSRKEFLSLSASNCQMDELRATTDKCIADSVRATQCANIPSIQVDVTQCSSNITDKIFCGEDKNTLEIYTSLPREYSCCFDCYNFNRDAVISSVVIAVGMILIIVVLLLCCLNISHKIDDLENQK